MTKRITIFLFLFTVSGAVLAADSGLDLLKPNHGARQTGIGGTGVALANDVNGVFYNPAANATMDDFNASFSHTEYWENVRLETGTAVWSLSDKTNLLAGIRYGSADNLEKRGNVPTTTPDSYFDNQDISFKLGLSYVINERLYAGISGGLFFEKIDVWDGSAFNFDLGLMYLLNNNLTLGASVMNIGSEFTLSASGSEDSRPITLPTTYSIGASYSYDKYLGLADLVILDDEAHLHLGAEGQIHKMFKLRTGYMINYESKNFTAGVSFIKRNLEVDYAFVPYSNDLGSAHTFQFTFSL